MSSAEFTLNTLLGKNLSAILSEKQKKKANQI